MWRGGEGGLAGTPPPPGVPLWAPAKAGQEAVKRRPIRGLFSDVEGPEEVT